MSQILNHLKPYLGATFGNMRLYSKYIWMPCRSVSSVQQTGSVDLSIDPKNPKKPKKFTSSEAYINYRSFDNFHGNDDRDLPNSHNYVLALSFILGIYYLIFLRDDIEGGGGKNLLQPLHETVPELAIPLLQAAIAENKKFGHNTDKLEKKLKDLMKEPEKHGGGRSALVEN